MEDGRRAERLEQLEHPRRGRGAARTVLVVQGQVGDALGRHRPTKLALDERVDQEGHAEAEAKGVEASAAFEREWRCLDHPFERGVAALDSYVLTRLCLTTSGVM